MTFDEFRANDLVQDAVVRELEIIGEAATLFEDVKNTADGGVFHER